MVELKIQKLGDSLGVILPDEVLNHLNRREGETVVVVEGPAGKYSLSQPQTDYEV